MDDNQQFGIFLMPGSAVPVSKLQRTTNQPFDFGKLRLQFIDNFRPHFLLQLFALSTDDQIARSNGQK